MYLKREVSVSYNAISTTEWYLMPRFYQRFEWFSKKLKLKCRVWYECELLIFEDITLCNVSWEISFTLSVISKQK